jgi:S-adenosylmethionine synthetase
MNPVPQEDTLIVEALADTPVARRRQEIIERKGIGHPDTICDSVVEAVSVALNRMYLDEIGAIPHYNVDKALLIAGQCSKGFGYGEILRPMELIIGDRATVAAGGRALPVERVAVAAAAEWIEGHLPAVRAERNVSIRLAVAPGSEELSGIYEQQSAALIASNDSCGASGYAPLSPAEELVLAVEGYLNSSEFKTEFPDTGQDVKVLAVRSDSHVALTIAMPLGCLAIASEAAYFKRKSEILDALRLRFDTTRFALEWRLNCLDRPGRGSAGAYLTLTGTSAEDADSGQVGRGNRVNGLIAFSRPTGGEAAAGKNPVAHAGKIYSVLSHRLASLLHARCPELAEVYVHLAVRIGERVDQPWTGVQAILPPGASLSDFEPVIREVIRTELARMPQFRAELIRGEHRVC